jgi:protein SCO1/2
VISQRTRLALLALSLIAAVAIALGILLSGGDSSSGDQSGGYSGSLLPADVPSAGFNLLDQNGDRISLTSLAGKPAIVTFLYTSCKDICPLTSQQIRGALDQVGHDIPVVAISVDPKNDTPAAVKSWLAREQVAGRFTWGLGSESQLQPIWRAWGVAPQTSSSDHSAYVFILDRNGRRCVSWPTSELTPEGLAHDISLIEKRGGSCRV